MDTAKFERRTKMRKFQKIFTVTAMAFSVFVCTAYASDSVYVKEDYENNRIIFSGDSDIYEAIGITIFKSGKGIADLPNEGVALEAAEYVNTAYPSEDGKYTFDININSGTGDYKWSIRQRNGNDKDGVIHFVHKDDLKAAISILNNASEAEFAARFSENIDKLGIDNELYAKINKETFMRMLYNQIKTAPLSVSDLNKSRAVINNTLIAAGISDGTITSLEGYATFCETMDSRTAKWCQSKIFTADIEKAVLNECKGNYTSLKSFNNKFTEILVMQLIKKPSGWGNVKEIISDYASEIGVTVSGIKDSTYASIAGNAYNSYSALGNAIKEINVSDKINGGGGSGSGGGTSTNNKPADINIPAQLVTNNQMKPVELKSFEDIDSVSWAYESIMRLYNREIVAGKEENRFYPNDNVTREEFVKMLLIAAKCQKGEYEPVFDDVKETDWFMPYVIGAYNASMCNGIGNGLFGSGMNITRQDMSCMVYNLIKNKNIEMVNEKNEFSDNDDISDYAKDAVSVMQMAGILRGRDNNIFAPGENATRAEAAVVINAILIYFE